MNNNENPLNKNIYIYYKMIKDECKDMDSPPKCRKKGCEWDKDKEICKEKNKNNNKNNKPTINKEINIRTNNNEKNNENNGNNENNENNNENNLCDSIVCSSGSANPETCELFSDCNCEWQDETDQGAGEGECVEREENKKKNKKKNKERFGNILSGFEFNDSCMIITIVFIILFMYKEEIMKSTIVKKLLK